MSDDNMLEHDRPLVALNVPSKIEVVNDTHWFEGDINFSEMVVKLQAEGVLDKTPYTLPLPYLSLSQVEQYLRCPTQYEFRYVKGIKNPPSIALVQGSTVHKAVEDSYNEVIRTKTLPTLEFALSSYSDALDKNLQGDVVWEDDPDSEDMFAKKDKGQVKDQGTKLVTVWHKNKLPSVKPRAVEKSFISNIAGVPLVGKIDLIDRVGTSVNPDDDKVEFHPDLDLVCDNKIVGKAYAKSKVENALQLSLYAHATGLPKQRYDLFVKTKIPKIMEMLTSRDAQQIRWALHTVKSVAEAISKGSFPPCASDSFLCNARFCGYYFSCRGAI